MCEIALESSEKCVFRRIVLLHGATRLYHSFFIPDTVAFDLSVVYAEHGAAADHVKPSVNGKPPSAVARRLGLRGILEYAI